jgi:hypothetical protein
MTRADIRSVGCNCNNTLLGQSLRFSCPADTCHILEQLVRSIGVVVVVVVVVAVIVVVVVVVKKQAVVHIRGPVKKHRF